MCDQHNLRSGQTRPVSVQKSQYWKSPISTHVFSPMYSQSEDRPHFLVTFISLPRVSVTVCMTQMSCTFHHAQNLYYICPHCKVQFPSGFLRATAECFEHLSYSVCRSVCLSVRHTKTVQDKITIFFLWAAARTQVFLRQNFVPVSERVHIEQKKIVSKKT